VLTQVLILLRHQRRRVFGIAWLSIALGPLHIRQEAASRHAHVRAQSLLIRERHRSMGLWLEMRCLLLMHQRILLHHWLAHEPVVVHERLSEVWIHRALPQGLLNLQ